MSIENLLSQMDTLLTENETVNRMSFFQLRYFIIGKEPTVQARLRKCLTELESRRDSIKNILLSIEEAQDDIEALDLQRASINTNDKLDEIKVRKLQRKKIALERTIVLYQKTLKELQEEAGFFLNAYQEIEKVEPLKPFDDFQTNAQLWNERYNQEMSLRLLLQRPFDLELVKAILSLDSSIPIRNEMINILEQLKQQKTQPSKCLCDKKTQIGVEDQCQQTKSQV
jgi:hypothetical protein